MTRQKIVTLLTDFGWQDVYVGVMKGVIATVNSDLHVINLTHAIPPQDLIAGSFALASAYSYFPKFTVHVAVIDPGVGSQRRGIAIKTEESFFIGADNGLFEKVLRQTPAIAAVELTNKKYWHRQTPSTTFHGRDIFAAVGAHLANGVDFFELGTEISPESLVPLSIPRVTYNRNEIIGSIQYIDRFGNLISDIPGEHLFSNLQVKIKNFLIPWGTTYSSANPQESIALIGSHGYLEIAINGGSAQQKLAVKTGETVIVNNLK